jgi:hypothetical protein
MIAPTLAGLHFAPLLIIGGIIVRFLMATLFVLMLAGPALAEMVNVEIISEVEYSQVRDGILANTMPGDLVVASFLVDSDNFIDSTSYGVRAYPIVMTSYQLTVGSVGPISIVDPQPNGATIYFQVRESDPVSDGFCLSGDPEWYMPNPYIDVPGKLEPYMAYEYEIGYLGHTLDSRDILDIAGTYGYDGIESFYSAVQDGWADALGLLYLQTVITAQSVSVEETSWGNVKSLFR